jgi:hypothetical protein
MVGDWHDRYRPGVVRRIKATGGTCSLDNHQPRRAITPADYPAPCPVPGAAVLIAQWWTSDRDQPAPDTTALEGDLR